ncbi:MAG TPA: protein-disulfide reductase DsbD family protein [Fibrobacteria bacterium]|nr:protein-disulfide reductase DsbD family protein [Fibrobacteria bacterium]
MIHSILLLLVGAASTPHVQVSLVAEPVSAQPGKSLSVALRLVPEPGWHFYWTNPGDAGVPPSVAWKTLSGVGKVDSLQWPVPETIPVDPLMTYGYHGETLLPFSVQVDPAAKGKVRLSGSAKWLECKEICVPGKAELDLELPVAASEGAPDARWQALFAKARGALPAALDGWTFRAVWTDSFLVVSGKGAAPLPAGLRFFPLQTAVADNPSPQQYQATPDGFRLTIRRDVVERRIPDTLRGVLVPSSPWKGHPGVKLDAPLGKASASDTLPVASPPAKGAQVEGGSESGLWKALFLAFLGGMILNLMPCVLPVLSLKVLDLAGKGGQDRRVALAHGAVYSLGVVASFLGLAAVLLVLRAGGESLGWGFHLQSPQVVAALSLLMALIAMNLWGLFEVGTFLASKVGGVESRGWAGSFLTGVTATLVASPCSAPFMGTALGYTLALPAWQTLLVFFALGLGMALPYLVLSAVPRLLAWIPKPGAWMETLKQGLGFAMAAAAVWLGWLVGRLAGSDSLAMVAATWVVVGLGGWILGRYALGHRAPGTRWAARGAFVACLALAGWGIASGVGGSPRPDQAESSTQELFREGTLQELRGSGKPWFLYFTADWCTTCLVNEGTALHRPAVRRKLEERGVRVVKADWTARDSIIGVTLASFGRQGVPYYVLSDGITERVLPEILTEGMVLSALDSLAR